MAQELAHIPCDLAHGPLLRAALLHLCPQEHWLLLCLHHIITDGWSLSDSFPVDRTDPDVYPNAGTLRWQPVQAEREGIVLIGRYRRDPNRIVRPV